MTLRLDVMFHQLAVGIEHVTGDRVVFGTARTNSGQEQQIADASRVWVCANGSGSARGMHDVVHGFCLPLLMTIDCLWRITLARSRERISYLPGRNQSSAIGYGSVLLRRMSP